MYTNGYGTSHLIDFVRGHGGTLAHVLGALGRFRLRHGHWPSRVFLYPETLAALVQDLTPLGFYRVQQRLDVVADLERDLFCSDDCGNVAVYRIQAPSNPASVDAAAVWLGLALPAVASTVPRPPTSSARSGTADTSDMQEDDAQPRPYVAPSPPS
ncbi:hypothetical protein PCA31118_01536 [Pandoraea captiosa]|uniref:Uncharacterized protein n=1 Tax=Pandoraea captiosa TaxID=2508302 RepID=A0A5E4ZUR5_9BURK|nr:hypothetical protein [Pandoraea captiosa]VVE64232.1 hypothetical protein PCA31118_01536 [Pandoraea captiosa]